MKLWVSILLSCFVVLTSVNAFEPTSYNLPKNKQGIADRNYDLLSESKYSILENKLNIGIQKYNYYWEKAEDRIPSSLFPAVCDQDYLLFPKNETQKERFGLHRYHCYKKRFIQQWQKRFEFNKKHDIQIAIVLWTAPKMYRDPGCEGFYFPLQKRYLTGGCYPSSEHYDDYEDWIRFTAHRFGKYIDHYIVWNEVDSTNWADTSTTRYPKKEMIKDLKFHMKRSFAIYAEILKRTIKTVNELDHKCMNVQGKCSDLVYVSLTRDWYSRIPTFHRNKKDAIHIRWRNMNLLDYLWNELGLDYGWSIAVHPYGNVYDKFDNGLTFSTLKDLLAYQKAQIDSRKAKNRSWHSYPQSILFASEQNAGHDVRADDWRRKAQFICESYDVALRMPELIAITDNHFQDNIHGKKITKHTMLPPTVKADLSDAEKYETFRAFLSTTPDVWGKRNDHYCCRTLRLGCIK